MWFLDASRLRYVVGESGREARRPDSKKVSWIASWVVKSKSSQSAQSSPDTAAIIPYISVAMSLICNHPGRTFRGDVMQSTPGVHVQSI